MVYTKEQIAAFRAEYEKALSCMVLADSNVADYAKKYVEEHPAGSDESLYDEMQHEGDAMYLARLECRFN